MSKSFTAERADEATQYEFQWPSIALDSEKYGKFRQRMSGDSEHNFGSQMFCPAMTDTSVSQVIWGLQQPASWPKVSAAINSSREMTAWPGNWDGDGALPISESTWERAATFIAGCAWRFWDLTRRDVPVPAIQPGRNGSIDIEWSIGERNLLLNVPPSSLAPLTYYGDDSKQSAQVEGAIAADSDPIWLLFWLTA